jgi:hypothetical protein
MRAMYAAVDMKNFQVLTDRDLGSAEVPGQVRDQDPAVPIQNLKDVSASLFVQHRFHPRKALSDFVTRLLPPCILRLTVGCKRK